MDIIRTSHMPDLAALGLKPLASAAPGDCLARGRIMIEHGRMGSQPGNPMLLGKFETVMAGRGPGRRLAAYPETAETIRAGLLAKSHGIQVDGRMQIEIMSHGVLLRSAARTILFIDGGISAHGRLAAETTARYIESAAPEIAA